MDETDTTALIDHAPDDFLEVVDWIGRLVTEHRCPGALVGVSGTDSVVTYLACHVAFARLGRASDVLGVHYGLAYPPPNRTPDELARILSFSPDHAWVPRVLVPWLSEAAPESEVVVDPSVTGEDNARWAALMTRSLDGTNPREMMAEGRGRWVFGTRNATEQALGTYSNLSRAASVLPVVGLWKSDVLRICADLGVPEVAMRQSRTVDCDCGRYDVAADHVEEVDAVLQIRAGLRDDGDLDAMMAPDVRTRVEAFVVGQIHYGAFKAAGPHAPDAKVRCKVKMVEAANHYM